MNLSNWKQSFPAHILSRGRNYYYNGKVKGLTASKDSLAARVRGSQMYFVTIRGLASGRLDPDCTCPYAADGSYCKHMAAVLYEYEDYAASHQPAPAPVRMIFGGDQFPDTPERKALYFNIHSLASKASFSEETLKTASGLVENRSIRCSGFSMEYQRTNSGVQLFGTIRAAFLHESREYETSARFSRREMIHMNCPVCDRYSYFSISYDMTDLCVHKTALLLLLDDYLYRVNPGDSTDYEGSKFLKSFRQSARNAHISALEKRPEISLEPRIIREADSMKLSFRIGTQKLYVLKDMKALCNTVSESGTLELGKMTTLFFAEQTFTEDSLRCFDFIRQELRRIQELERQWRQAYYSANDLFSRSELTLTGDTLDRFYDLFEGKRISFKDKLDPQAASSVLLEERPLQAKMQIRPKRARRRFEGIIVEGTLPELIHGAAHMYVYENGYLSRINSEDYNKLAPLFEAEDWGQFRFVIGEKSLSDFYYQALPMLQESGLVEITEKEPDVIAEHLRPQPQWQFFLDVQNGMPFCRGDVLYQDARHPLKRLYLKDLPVESYRNVFMEMHTCDAIARHFPEYDEENGVFLYEGGEEDLLADMAKAVHELSELGEVHATDAFDRLKIRRMPAVRVGVAIESSLLDLSISSDELSTEELLDILASYRLKKKYHRLRDGRFIGLENDETLESLTALMDSMQLSAKDLAKGNMQVPAYRALYLNKMLEEHEELAGSRDRHFRKIIRDFGNLKNADAEIPASLASVLRRYQTEGFQWIHLLRTFGFGGILADDMGLGKTLQVIAVLLSEKEAGSTLPSLVVCPASLVYNWLEEIRRFAPALQAVTVTGSHEERLHILQQGQKEDVLITSYDLLKRDIADYDGLSFQWQILDEAQYIKNPKTASARSVKAVQSAYRLALTGTPIENRLSELWSIFDFLMPGFLYGYETFRRQFETPIVKNKDAAVTERLQKMASPFILRRLKKDVLKDLPDKLEEVRYCGFEPEQQRLYDAQVAHLKTMLAASGSDNTDKIAILAELTKIRQICCDPSLLVENYSGLSAKREACLDLIRSAVDGGHKLLVFSQFTSMLAILEEALKEQQISYYLLTGSTPKEERVRLMHAFNKDDTSVFLISLKAGGTGLNLTGADIVIHYDPWWNFSAQNQATDRAHRIGQTKLVSVYRLIVRGTIEEKILKLQTDKKDLADTILSGEQTSLAALSAEELAALFEV